MSLDEARLGFGTDAPNFPGGIPPNTFYMLVGDNAYSYSYSGTILPSLIGDLDTYYVKTTPGHSYTIVAVPSSLLGSAAASPNFALLDKNGFVLSIGSGGGLVFTATSDSYYVQGYAASAGFYALRLGNNTIVEQNGIGEEISQGGNYSASIDYTSDVDIYSFWAEVGETYVFDISSGVSDLFLDVENVYGEQVDRKVSLGSGSFTFDPPQTGYYNLHLSSNSFVATGAYSFTFSRLNTEPTYSLSRVSASANEGTTATFTLSTTNVAASTAVAYTISGVSSADVVGGALSGSVNVGSNGQATISIPIAADNLTEGSETLTVTAQGKSASVTINDSSLTPQPTYALSASAGTVQEGTNASFTFSKTFGAPGSSISYAVTGVSLEDVAGALTGTVPLDSRGQATITIPIVADSLTEGPEILSVSVNSVMINSVTKIDLLGVTASTLIEDTSTSPIPPPVSIPQPPQVSNAPAPISQPITQPPPPSASTSQSDSQPPALPTEPTQTFSLDILVSLFGEVFLLKGLNESKSSDTHTVEYNGEVFNYEDVDFFVTTVVRDGEFTDEFAQEIADAYPEVAGIKYSVAASIVGSSLDEIIIQVAGADGNYVG